MPNSTVTNVALMNGTSPAHSAALPRFNHPTPSASLSFPKGSFFSSASASVESPMTATKNHRPMEPSATAFLGASSSNGTIEHAENGGNGQQPMTVILTVRMLMQGKEVGSIIGKRGDYVRQIREQSGAKVNISDGSCPERIVTISGSSSSINKAFAMVAQKFEEDMQAQQNATGQKPPITLRLLVPASQCGSLIGKGGAKIREIRDKTGASLQVASEMLSNSTEKPVTISGTSEALIGCMREVCQILLDAPAKGPTIQYKPINQAYNPLAVANSAAAIAAAAAAVTAAQQQHKTMPCGIGTTAVPSAGTAAAAQFAALLPHANPSLLSVHEVNGWNSKLQLALLQQHNHQQQQLLLQHHQQNSNPFPCVDPIVSRFLLHPPVSSAPSSASAVSNALLANHPTLLINQLQGTVASPSAAASQKIDGMELYGAAAAAGLDPATLALLQQHNQAVDAMALLQQQQQMILYQQQQQQQQHHQLQQQQQNDIGHENQLSGRAIGPGGKPEKKKSNDGIGTASSSVTAHQQKRFTPY
ncbi:hypothetical protein niasHT_039019 [Heterodera trifolii]|uniref:K Homology domain-containing protein n=1 Tax=Heterodera trifolii TaxID=157864 RepID=A0ABD2J5E9_9BILA